MLWGDEKPMNKPEGESQRGMVRRLCLVVPGVGPGGMEGPCHHGWRRSALILAGLLWWLLSGCLPMVAIWSPLPENAGRQLVRHVEGEGDALLIPLIWRGRELWLGDPQTCRHPFADAAELFSGHEIGLVSIVGGVGSTRNVVAFLLLGADGTVYDIDVDDFPDEPDEDMFFWRARLSATWLAEAQRMAEQPRWGVYAGESRHIAAGTQFFWHLNSLRGLMPMHFRWQHPEVALPAVREFLGRHPLVLSGGVGEWEEVRRPCFTPNVVCEQGLHPLPEFAAGQILWLSEVLQIRSVTVSKGHTYTVRERYLQFPDDVVVQYDFDIEKKIRKLVRSGAYRVMAYQPPTLAVARGDYDPERRYHAPLLRRLARDCGLPLVIVPPDEADAAAPAYPGLPAGRRQYWHCPGCLRQAKP